MKRFLRYYLPASIILVSLVVWGGFFLLRNPTLPLYVLNRARLHGAPLAAQVFINDVEYPGIRVYSLERYRTGPDGRKFLVYAPGVEEIHPVTVVDETNRDIGITNGGDHHYQIFFNRFLFQADSAYAVVWASDKVKWGYDPKMVVADAKVTYFMSGLKGEDKMEIEFHIE
jgi:hypothetical protein